MSSPMPTFVDEEERAWRSRSRSHDQMTREFPKFDEEEGSGKIILSHPTRYKKLTSGIYYESIRTSVQGNPINSPNQLVTINYCYFAMDAKLLHTKCINSSLAEFADEFTFTADITEAMMGMRVNGQRRIIILPEIHENGQCRVVDVTLVKIKYEENEVVKQNEGVEQNEKEVETKEVGQKGVEQNQKEGEKVVNKNEEVEDKVIIKYIIDKVFGNSVLGGGGVVAAVLGSAPAINYICGMIPRLSNTGVIPKDTEAVLQKLQLDEKIKCPAQNAYINETKALPNFHTDEQTMYPARNPFSNGKETKPKPKLWEGFGRKITYKVMNEGEGGGVTRYQQVCFEYNKIGSMEAINFDGSPTEFAMQLFQGFEDAMLEAILGMKLNGRRIIFIPVEVSGLREDIVLDLKLTALNPRSRM